MNLAEPSARRRRRSRRAGTGSGPRGWPSPGPGPTPPGGGGQVAHHHDLRLQPRPQAARAVSYSQLVPGTRGWPPWGGRFGLAHRRGTPVPGEGARRGGLPRPGGVHVLQHPLVEGEQLVNGGVVAADGDHRLRGGDAQPARQGKSISSVSSATMERGQGVYQFVSTSGPMAKPILLPKDMFMTVSAKPCSTAHAGLHFPPWQFAELVPGRLALGAASWRRPRTGTPGAPPP